jgi:methylglutaconyl-CoA hydratase
MSELVISEGGPVRFLTLNRPEKRNALNEELIASLKAALRSVEDEKSIRVIVIRGAGSDFCSGADLATIKKLADSTFEDNLEDARQLMELYSMIRRLPVPVIAAVHGRALAGGAGLATACDIVLAARSSRFGYPEVRIGFVPAMVMAILRRNLGEKIAFELSTLGFEFTAERAHEIGLVNRVLDDAIFETEVQQYADSYAAMSRSAIAATKKLLYRMDDLNFDEAIQAGAEVNAEVRMSKDCRDGIARFLKKDAKPR